MRTRWLAVLVLTAALGLFAPYSFADHGRGHGDDHGKRNPHADRDHGRDNDHDRGRDRDDDRRWERRGNHEVRVYEVREGRPPGWVEGRKVGWANCDMPPGLAKKYGCRTYVYQNRRYYYYHDDVGRIIVRRPWIDIHIH